MSVPLVSLPPTRSALAAPFVVIGQEFRQISELRGPFVGGLLGTVLGCAALLGAMFSVPRPAGAEPEPLMEIDFIPASVIAIGDVDGEAGATQTSDPQQPDEPGSSQTDPPAVPEPTPAPDPGTTPQPEPHEPSPHPTPHPSPTPGPHPTPSPEPGKPLGDPSAWTELIGGGDPWAVAVMKALRSMKVPAWAGKISTDSPFQFRLVICKDGRISDVLRKQSTGDTDLDATLEHEISRVVLPPVPASIAATMSKSCVALGYQFTWSAVGVD